MKKRGVIVAFIVGSVYLFPSLLAPVTFSTFIGLGNTLDFNLAVASLVLFNLMKEPMISIPMFFSDIIELVVSMRRIEKFLNLYEVQTDIIERKSGNDGEHSIEIKGNFSWGFSSKEKEKEADKKDKEVKKSKKKEENKEKGNDKSKTSDENEDEMKSLSKFMTLKAIDLKVKKGEFVCIIGDVGSGKSSLLSSIIGDLIYVP